MDSQIDIRLNWVPVIFSSNTIRVLFRQDLPDSQLYDDYFRYDKIKAVTEETSMEPTSGYFLFSENPKTEKDKFVTLDINLEENKFPVNQYILAAISKSLDPLAFRSYRSRIGLSIIQTNSKKEIRDLHIYDEFGVHPHFIHDRRNHKIFYGFVTGHTCYYELQLKPEELDYFINRTVRIDTGERKITGELVSSSNNTAIIRHRKRLEKFNYKTEEIEFPVEVVKPVGSVTNILTYFKRKYPDEFRDLDRRRKILSKDLIESGQKNQNLLRDKYQLINNFLKQLIEKKNLFSIFSDAKSSFKIETNFIPLDFGKTEKLSLPGKRLSHRQFRFSDSNDNQGLGQYQGIKINGPYKKIDSPEEIKYLFIFPKSNNNLANDLFFALKNGLGAFPGIETLFGMPIDRKNVMPIQVPGTNAKQYQDAIENFLANHLPSLNVEKTLAFIISPEMTHGVHPNPYHASKSILFKHGIASQGIDFDTIQGNNFRWSISNIALASFAKLGGIPWRIENNLEKRQLIFGVGQRQIFDERTQVLKRIVGFTVCVTPDGQFESVTTFRPYQSKEDFLQNLKQELQTAIRHALNNATDIDELIVHFPRRSNRDEIKQIEKALNELSTETQKLLTYSVVRIIESDPFLLWDLAHQSCLPAEGVLGYLSSSDTLLCIPGRQEKKSIHTVPKYPLRITLLNTTSSSTNFEQVVYQIYALAGANWRGFNARELPITIFYSQLVADLIGDLEHYENNYFDGLRKLEKIPWFL